MRSTVVAILTVTLLFAGQAMAQGGWSSNQMSNPRGDRGEGGGRDTERAAYERLRRDFPGQSTHAQERSGGVGDQTGHSAQMEDKAIR